MFTCKYNTDESPCAGMPKKMGDEVVCEKHWLPRADILMAEVRAEVSEF